MTASPPRAVRPIGRVTAIAAATVALLGAVVANLDVDVSADGATAARTSAQLAARESGTEVRASTDLGDQQQLASIAAEYDRRSVLAADDALGADPTAAAQFQAEARIWADAATSVARLSGVARDTLHERTSLTGTPTLNAVNLFEVQLNASRDRVELERTAASERASDLGAKSSAYISIIALLAVALFLLGLSLTVPDSHHWLVAAATLIIGAAIVWVVNTTVRPIPSTPQRAINALAQSRVLLSRGAGTPEGSRLRTTTLKAAERKLDEAIRLRSDYPEAYARRSQIRFVEAFRFRGGVQLVNPILQDRRGLRAAIDDGERAMALGYSQADLPLNLAVDYNQDGGRYQDALAMNRRAIDRNPDEPLGWFNEVVYATGLGDSDLAEHSLGQGIRRLATPTYRNLASQYIATTQTELERIAALHPERTRLFEQLVGRLVVEQLKAIPGVGPFHQVRPGQARAIGTPSFTIDGGLITTNFKAAAPTGTPFLFLWYQRDDARAPWVDLPFTKQYAVAMPFAPGGPSGVTSGVNVNPQIDPGPCGGRGTYRLDIWAGNRRISSTVATKPGTHDPLQPASKLGAATLTDEPVLGFQLCRPAPWKIQRPQANVLRVTRPDGRASVEVSSEPIGALTPEAASALEDSTVQRVTADLGPLATVAPLAPGSAITTFRFGTVTARLGIYRVAGPDGDHIAAVAASMGEDGFLRTVHVEAPVEEPELAADLLFNVRVKSGVAIAEATQASAG